MLTTFSTTCPLCNSSAICNGDDDVVRCGICLAQAPLPRYWDKASWWRDWPSLEQVPAGALVAAMD